MFPTFIIIGGMKCGTSSLYHYLNLHSEIGMSDTKELDYFIAENNFNKGVEWYKSQFYGDYRKFGEASPNYSKAHFFGGVPERMSKLLPDVKLIYLVRDPVERIISHYMHNIADGREQQSIEQALEKFEDNHYVLCSCYYWQLEYYLEYFPADQILIVNSHNLRDQRMPTLQTIFRFIGVDESFYTDEYVRELHKTGEKRKRGQISRIILDSPVIRTLKGFIPDTFKDSVKKKTRPVVKRPEISADLKEKLTEHFRTDVTKLREFTGQNFEEWDI